MAFDGSDLGLNWFKTRLNLTNSHKAINEQTLFLRSGSFRKASFNNPHFQLRVVLFLKSEFNLKFKKNIISTWNSKESSFKQIQTYILWLKIVFIMKCLIFIQKSKMTKSFVCLTIVKN